MKTMRDLDSIEVRVLGTLLEKEQTTPDYYPMTVNSLVAACNQKSNRDPVTSLTETEVVDALESMRRNVFVWRSEGARVERWSQSVSRRLDLDPAAKAVLTLLMLRGPQTPGELRSRGRRMVEFADLEEVERTLAELASEERSLVVELPRQPGQKESRWAHLLAGPVAQTAAAQEPAAAPAATPAPSGLAARVEELERRVERLADEVAKLRGAGD